MMDPKQAGLWVSAVLLPIMALGASEWRKAVVSRNEAEAILEPAQAARDAHFFEERLLLEDFSLGAVEARVERSPQDGCIVAMAEHKVEGWRRIVVLPVIPGIHDGPTQAGSPSFVLTGAGIGAAAPANWCHEGITRRCVGPLEVEKEHQGQQWDREDRGWIQTRDWGRVQLFLIRWQDGCAWFQEIRPDGAYRWTRCLCGNH